MSTRCNIHIKARGANNDEVMLYRHCDGYPDSILPDIYETWHGNPHSWEMGRAGKVGAMLIIQMGGEAEPMTDLCPHGDIEYLYQITLHNPRGGCIGDIPFWVVEVFSTNFWGTSEEKVSILKFTLEDGESVDLDSLLEAANKAV